VPLVEQGIAQATRRVLHDEQVPAQQKILSLFEEHTQIITRQKMGKPREFGRKVLIEEVDGGIISRYEILEEVGREHPHLPASLEAHQEHFRRAPQLLAADREASTGPRTRDWPTKLWGKAPRATQERASLARAGAA
jgi:transposase, IS5 family